MFLLTLPFKMLFEFNEGNLGGDGFDVYSDKILILSLEVMLPV